MPFDLASPSYEPPFQEPGQEPGGHSPMRQRIAAILKDWRPITGTARRPVGRATDLIDRVVSARRSRSGWDKAFG